MNINAFTKAQGAEDMVALQSPVALKMSLTAIPVHVGSKCLVAWHSRYRVPRRTMARVLFGKSAPPRVRGAAAVFCFSFCLLLCCDSARSSLRAFICVTLSVGHMLPN
eukprot:3451256-Prymnesium_polylepis.1